MHFNLCLAQSFSIAKIRNFAVYPLSVVIVNFDMSSGIIHSARVTLVTQNVIKRKWHDANFAHSVNSSCRKLINMSALNCFAIYNASLPSNCTTSPPSEHDSKPREMATLRLLAYAVIFVFGVGGNLLVILTIRRPHMKTVTNVFITNLAVADFLVCILNVPMVTTLGHLGYWPFGELMCKFLSSFQGMSLSASVGTLIAVAADRFKMCVLYQQPNTKLHHAYMCVALIWILSTVLPFPLLLFSRVIQGTNGKDLCVEIWPDTSSRKMYTLLVAVLLYFIPLAAICLLYSLIIRKLWSLKNSQKGN